ncbi:carbamate kinase [Exiguobacterium aestuarii]|uniref:Carbamate kinase n=1 Tax=Exiguobacterium aestuarii TaxID=273527 RepID=A0ABW2PKX2_9BACL|nr:MULTISPECIES: carbamate kinase [Exiguobacterium]MCT4784910.1 carbamate kinase [Exiguobacterium aestuarii]
MGKKRVVIALGGNAIQQGKDATAEAQMRAVEATAESLATLIAEGFDVIITHGNGPQVGNLMLQQAASDSPATPAMPLDVCGAMTQGMIGYWFENALTKALRARGLEREVASLVTRSVVDPNDSAFHHPTKPIGPFYTEEEALHLERTTGYVFKEDAGRGHRRVVPSPVPVQIAEHAVIRTLVEAGHIVVASGGGGIPVMETAEGYVGIEAVIDKDFAAAKLADLVNADVLLILTAVEHVYVNFGKPDEVALQETSKEQMETYIAEGQFAPGSMLPKVRAALQFAESGTNRVAIITSLDQALAAIDGDAGTRVRLAPSLQQ